MTPQHLRSVITGELLERGMQFNEAFHEADEAMCESMAHEAKREIFGDLRVRIENEPQITRATLRRIFDIIALEHKL